MAQHPPLNLITVQRLGHILDAAQRARRVTWMSESGHLVDAVARSITHQGGGFLGPEDDIRDGYLWTSGLFESWIPVTDVLQMIDNGTLYFHD